MWWKYKQLEATEKEYRYAYSMESDSLDGIIVYDIATGEIVVERLCANDVEYPKFGERKAKEHFYKVIRDGFPEFRSVCIG